MQICLESFQKVVAPPHKKCYQRYLRIVPTNKIFTLTRFKHTTPQLSSKPIYHFNNHLVLDTAVPFAYCSLHFFCEKIQRELHGLNNLINLLFFPNTPFSIRSHGRETQRDEGKYQRKYTRENDDKKYIVIEVKSS